MKNLKTKIVYHGFLRETIGKSSEEVLVKEGTTIRELISLLEKRYGEHFSYYILYANGELRRSHTEVLLNGVKITSLKGLDTKLVGNSEVHLVFFTPVGGG